MKIATTGQLGTAVVAAAAVGMCVSAGSNAFASNRPPCVPKVTTVQGKHVVAECGPATVTLRAGGKTYSFRNGFCMYSASAKNFELDLGTLVVGARGNGGKPYLSMSLAPVGGYVSEADFGGKKILVSSQIKVRGGKGGKVPLRASFTGTQLLDSRSFSGSWDCHGVVYDAP
jgi:hypothetical protein